MQGNVTIYALHPVFVENVTGATETELLENALLRAETELRAVTSDTLEIARYELEVHLYRSPSLFHPILEHITYHDADHLDQLHQERLDGAEIFALPEPAQTEDTQDTQNSQSDSTYATKRLLSF